MLSKHIKQFAALIILMVTVILFFRFFEKHPAYWNQLRHISTWTILWVILLNILMLAVLAGIVNSSVKLCGRRIGARDNFLLTSYSSLINFFGPLQSGPGVRGVYLKTKYGVRLRDYTLATLLYLGLFAAFNAFIMLIGTRPWWQTLVALCLVAGFSNFVYQHIKKRNNVDNALNFALRPGPLLELSILTFLQVLITVAWYFIELRAVNSNISLHQAMSYSGAANFALFVSITPDAIGIREAFLTFTQQLHHISLGNIISANLIDRAAYVLFLAMLFIVLLLTHAKTRLSINETDEPDL